MKIKVIIPTHNCEKWIIRCLDSVEKQNYLNYDVMIIADASTDNNAILIKGFCNERGSNWDYTINKFNERCPFNIWLGIEKSKPENDDIIFLLDGDDFLPNENIFNIIVNEYKNINCWLTYGSYDSHPINNGQTQAQPYPENVIRDRSFRHSQHRFNHPITFKYFLWKAMPVSELKDENGSWFRAAYDQAIMIPLLELAGENHKCLSDILYTYNSVNPKSLGFEKDPIEVKKHHDVAKIIKLKSKLNKLNNI